MEPNKFDKIIKEKMAGRTIQPSSQAWDRLDAMLTLAENDKPEKEVNWLAIAAVFIGFVLAGIFIFNFNTKTEVPNNSVVIDATDNKVESNDATIENPFVINEDNASKVEPVVVQGGKYQDVVKENRKREENYIPQNLEKSSKIDYERVIEFDSEETAAVAILPTVVGQKRSTINVDALQLLSSVDRKTIIPVRIDKVKVNPQVMLDDIEHDINYTFREKTLFKISTSLQSAKVAVINRNVE